MKKKILAVTAIVICLAILAAGTLAYFTDEFQVHNVITSSGVDITIEEWQEGEDGERTPYPDEPIQVMPGVTVSKIPTVKNLQAEAWIRARIDIEVLNAEGNPMTYDPAILNLNINAEDWTEGDDGWYYYNTAVDTDEVTEPLFTEVAFAGREMTNEYQNCTVNIVVSAQAVQTANNPIPEAGVTAIPGWPGEATETPDPTEATDPVPPTEATE